MANAEVNIKFIENRRGGRTLIHNDYMFRLKTEKGENSYWYCVKPTCPARINLNQDIPTKVTNNHNHERNPTDVPVASMPSKIRKRVRETTEPVQSVYEDLLSSTRSTEWDEATEEIIKNVPTFYSARSSLYRARGKLHPPLPKTRQDIVLEGRWLQTQAGENFLLADNGQEERILIFATTDNLTELSNADVWYMDGTFYSSPNTFYQLYTIHAKVGDHMFPLVYSLLPNKTRETYRRFFSILQTEADNRNLRLTPTVIMMDFEKASQLSVQEVFQTASVRGCFFHYTQCLWRKVQGLGLVRNFRESEDFKTLVRRAAVLPLVPSRDVDDVWFYALENNDSDSPQVEQFKDYITEQWVETDLTLWNHYDNHGPRTTNHIEGWHHKINNLVSRSHPNIYSLIDIIKKEQSMNEIKMLQFSNGGRQNPRKRKYRLIDQRLASLKDRLQAREIDIYHYAGAASHLIKLGA